MPEFEMQGFFFICDNHSVKFITRSVAVGLQNLQCVIISYMPSDDITKCIPNSTVN